MKSFFDNIKDLILRHKLLSIICFLAFIIIAIMMFYMFDLFTSGTDKYGHRLSGINEVKISNSDRKDVTSKLEENGEVSKSSIRLQGRIVYINITYTKETSLDKAKEIANGSLDNFDKKAKEYYDFDFFLTREDNGEEKGFVITGAKSPKSEAISWIKS